MLEVYDCTREELRIGPFSYEPMRSVDLLLQQSDDFLRQNLSTSPEVAPPLFVPHLRSTLKRIKDDPYPSVTLFHSNLPRFYRKDDISGQWLRYQKEDVVPWSPISQTSTQAYYWKKMTFALLQFPFSVNIQITATKSTIYYVFPDILKQTLNCHDRFLFHFKCNKRMFTFYVKELSLHSQKLGVLQHEWTFFSRPNNSWSKWPRPGSQRPSWKLIPDKRQGWRRTNVWTRAERQPLWLRWGLPRLQRLCQFLHQRCNGWSKIGLCSRGPIEESLRDQPHNIVGLNLMPNLRINENC